MLKYRWAQPVILAQNGEHAKAGQRESRQDPEENTRACALACEDLTYCAEQYSFEEFQKHCVDIALYTYRSE
jgi:hypothetical protein